MAQPGNFTPILLYGSSTPTNVPLAANLTNSTTGSEIAINVADKNLFFKDSGGVVNTVPIRQSSTSSNGWLSATDWNTFNGKAPATSGTSILYGNGSGGFSNVTIGSGISFAGGTLSATGSGGTVTSVAALTLGTTGTDLSSTVANGTTTPVITLNVPTASAANRGALSAADWSTFNGKQAALVSGTNIKTVGGVTLLGSGDVGTIGTGYGGTGLTSFNANGIIYATSSSALTTNTAFIFDGTSMGVGTSSASFGRLTLNAYASTPLTTLTIGDIATPATAVGIYFRCNGTNPVVLSTAGAPLAFAGGSSGSPEWARFDASGNWLVGTTSAPTGSANGSSLTSSGILQTSRAATGAVAHAQFYNPNGLVGSIQTSGTTTSYVTSSDYRLKENIAPMTGALNTVAKLKPVTYNWKVDGSSGQGFIAHELQAVVPDCVIGEKDAVDFESKPKYQGVDTSFLVATLTAAIQEQQAIIESLLKRISALEA